MRFLVLISLVLVGAAKGEMSGVDYAPCAAMAEGIRKDVCNSENFSRERLKAGSAEDLDAQGAAGYRTPNSDFDGRSGTSLESCGAKETTCMKDCAGAGACIQNCYVTMAACAASGTLGNPLTSTAEPPDGYTIEFDDTTSKNR